MSELSDRKARFEEWTRLEASCKDLGLGEPKMVPQTFGWHVIVGDGHLLGSDREPMDAIHHAMIYLQGYRCHKVDTERQYAEAKAKASAARDAAFEIDAEAPVTGFYDHAIAACGLTARVQEHDGNGGPADHYLLAKAIDHLAACILTMPKPKKRSKEEKTEVFSKIYRGR